MDPNERRLAVLRLTDRGLLGPFIPWGDWLRCTSGVPKDSRVLSIERERDATFPIWSLTLASAEFGEVPEGQYPPELPVPLYTSHTCDA